MHHGYKDYCWRDPASPALSYFASTFWQQTGLTICNPQQYPHPAYLPSMQLHSESSVKLSVCLIALQMCVHPESLSGLLPKDKRLIPPSFPSNIEAALVWIPVWLRSNSVNALCCSQNSACNHSKHTTQPHQLFNSRLVTNVVPGEPQNRKFGMRFDWSNQSSAHNQRPCILQ